MNQLHVDDLFSDALRTKLVTEVEKIAPSRAKKRARLWAGTAAVAGIGLLGGVGATAAGLFSTPGSSQVTPLASPVTEIHTGTATVQLGHAPEGATGIELQLNCLTPGRFEFEDGANATCKPEDVGTRQDWTGYTLPLTAGKESITITTSPQASWKLTAQYVNTEITDWAVNPHGDTYGAANENGSPDLVAVIATNGTSGYAYRTDLEDANGTTASKTFKSPADALAWQESIKGKEFVVPVYDSTGKTVVGEFVIGRGTGTSGVVGEPAPECAGVPPTLGPGETYPCPGLSTTETGRPAIPVPSK
ncbi:peptidase M56 family protein [Pseudarthrobacter sp. LT1]|uniref:peptidase M56 family protein n=1 Tax=Pseudarthrobacter sp. LT1 TaxID=3111450 RepID=UPI002D789B31|nr:peptidase M56 family protein [Pseudarthrobacter sp. LT1]WRT14275.1 peptidase M56 family protein [Pseudarthrobacter sp. LT1]